MNQPKTYQITVNNENSGNRIDKFLSIELKDVSRSHIQKWIDEGCVIVNTVIVKRNYKVKAGDIVDVSIPEVKEVEIAPTAMTLDIVYEDQDILIINKPVDMVVHPAPGHYTDTLVNGIMYHCKEQLSGINGELRPGIVHRIDKDTTGLLVVCKNDTAHVDLAAQLKAHSIERVYEAIVYNNIKDDEGIIEGPIGRHPKDRKKMTINHKNGKEATTHYRVIQRLKNGFTHVELQLETGRTHQIRVHMASIGHPLLGDPLYGPKSSPYKLPGQMLHARTLGFYHPRTKEKVLFNVEPPYVFLDTLRKLQP